MIREDSDTDRADSGGNSALHVAAKVGQLPMVSLLLHYGAQVDLKNAMGLKPVDLARAAGHVENVEYLLLFETAVATSADFVQSKVVEETVRAENEAVNSCYKDLIFIAKRLAKERDELCRDLGRLYDATMELHNNMTMEIQVLKKADDEESPSIAQCTTLHEKWQVLQRQWFSDILADSSRKIYESEDSWKTAKANSAVTNPEEQFAYAQRHFRDRLEELRSTSNVFVPKMVASSSEEEESDDEFGQLDEEAKRVRINIAKRGKLATPVFEDHRRQNSIYSSVSNDMYSKVGSPTGSIKGGLFKTATPPTPLNNGRSPVKSRTSSREELKQKLKEMALTSESGTASVLEVIEPTSSEEEIFKKSMKEMNMSWSAGSGGSPTKRLLEMGISAADLSDGDDKPTTTPTPTTSSSSILKKLSKWRSSVSSKKSSTSAEEHVLPDTFDDQSEKSEPKIEVEPNSVSPSGHSLTITLGDDTKDISEEKQKVKPVPTPRLNVQAMVKAFNNNTVVSNNESNLVEQPRFNGARLIEEKPKKAPPVKKKPSSSKKAWYDCGSDNEEAGGRGHELSSADLCDEANDFVDDSLASIISTRGASTDDDDQDDLE